MADDLRVEQLRPQAAPVNTYTVPEQRSNDDIRFKAAQLQNIFAKGQKLVDNYQQEMAKRQAEQYQTEAAFRAANTFAQFEADTWQLTQTENPENIQGKIDKEFNERFGGLFGDDADPWLAAAMSDRYQAYVPKAITEAGKQRNVRRQRTFLSDIQTNARNTIAQAARDNLTAEDTFGLLDGVFKAASGNKNGVTGAMINEQILSVGLESDEARNLILGYADFRKLKETNNPAYEEILLKLTQAGAKDTFAEWQFDMKGKLKALAAKGQVNAIAAEEDAVKSMGLKFDKSVDWYWDIKSTAETNKSKVYNDAYDKQQLNVSVQKSVQEKRYVQETNSKGNDVELTKVKKGLNEITDPEKEGTIESYGDVLTWHQNTKIKSIFDASTAALQRLDDNRPFGTDANGNPIWEIDGKPVTRAQFNATHVQRFTELAERVESAAGTAGLRMQLGKDAFRKWEVIGTLRRLGRNNEDIGRYLASPTLTSKISKDETIAVLKEVNIDQTDWNIFGVTGDTAGNTDDAFRTVQDYVNYVVSMNGGVRDDATLEAIGDTLKRHYDVLEFGGGHTLIETTNPNLVKAFARNGKPISKEDLRGELGIALKAVQKDLDFRYTASAKELKEKGLTRLNIDPESLIIREHPNQEGVYLLGDNMGNIIGTTTAEALAKKARKVKAAELNSDAEQTYLEETQTYVQGMLEWTEDSDYQMTSDYRDQVLKGEMKDAIKRLKRIQDTRSGTDPNEDELTGYDNWVTEEKPSDEVLKLQEDEVQAVIEYLESVGANTENLVPNIPLTP
jgi:hypothetical protein